MVYNFQDTFLIAKFEVICPDSQNAKHIAKTPKSFLQDLHCNSNFDLFNFVIEQQEIRRKRKLRAH